MASAISNYSPPRNSKIRLRQKGGSRSESHSSADQMRMGEQDQWRCLFRRFLDRRVAVAAESAEGIHLHWRRRWKRPDPPRRQHHRRRRVQQSQEPESLWDIRWYPPPQSRRRIIFACWRIRNVVDKTEDSLKAWLNGVNYILNTNKMASIMF